MALGNDKVHAGSQGDQSQRILNTATAEVSNSSCSSKSVLQKQKQDDSLPLQPEEALCKAPHTQEFIPRSDRRGLLGRFTIIPEATDAYKYPSSTKWIMTSLVAMAGVTSSTGSSIFFRESGKPLQYLSNAYTHLQVAALNEMAKDLHASQAITNLSLAFYMLAMAFSPLWWSVALFRSPLFRSIFAEQHRSTFSETLGRRTIYIVSFSLFVVFCVISAVSVDIAMLIVFRILSGAAAASVQSVGAGTAADIWESKERGRAMGLFYVGPICGPGLGPVIRGALTQGFGWRSTLWFLAIFGGIILLLLFLFLPETVARSEQPEQKVKLEVGGIFEALGEPLKLLMLLRYPAILSAVYLAAIAFGCLFIINVSIQSNLAALPYNFNATEVGLFYIAPTLGYCISSILGGRWIDSIMAREARKANRYEEDGKLKYLPEDCLRENILLGTLLYPAGLIWYGWVVDKGLHWIVPCIASFFFGLGMMLVFGVAATALTEFTPDRSSGGIALNGFIRNIFSCIATIVAQPLLDALGVGWMCTMVGLFALVTTSGCILLLRLKGPQCRRAMDERMNANEARGDS